MPEEVLTEAAQAVQDQWDTASNGGGTAICVPGSDTFVSIAKLECNGKKVSVWTSSDTSLPPDFVIVNPSTHVFLSSDNIVEDPLGAIAHAINGASQ